MRKIIKVIDEENIEISRYVSPEARFFNPCTDIHNDYDKYESYCDFKEVINPFKMYAENERLHSIIKEVRETLNTQLAFTSSYQLNYQSAMNIIEEAKRILDKGE